MFFKNQELIIFDQFKVVDMNKKKISFTYDKKKQIISYKSENSSESYLVPKEYNEFFLNNNLDFIIFIKKIFSTIEYEETLDYLTIWINDFGHNLSINTFIISNLLFEVDEYKDILLFIIKNTNFNHFDKDDLDSILRAAISYSKRIIYYIKEDEVSFSSIIKKYFTIMAFITYSDTNIIFNDFIKLGIIKLSRECDSNLLAYFLISDDSLRLFSSTPLFEILRIPKEILNYPLKEYYSPEINSFLLIHIRQFLKTNTLYKELFFNCKSGKGQVILELNEIIPNESKEIALILINTFFSNEETETLIYELSKENKVFTLTKLFSFLKALSGELENDIYKTIPLSYALTFMKDLE